jgi:CBS domain containing-hemolysin-like protein
VTTELVVGEVFGVLIAAVLLLLNAFFVAAEFALVSARRASIEPLAQAGSRRAATTLRAMERVSLMLAGAQLGVTVCSLGLGAISEPAIASLLEPVAHAVGLPHGAQHAVAFVVALALVTVAHVVIGEMVPKNIALAAPQTSALWLGPPLAMIVRALKPLIWLLNQSANLTVRALRVHPRDEVTSAFTPDEVAGLVEQSHQAGLLRVRERDLLSDALAFDVATAATVARPIDQLRTLDADCTPDDVQRLVAATGLTRFPVSHRGSLRGYVHVKDTLDLAAHAYSQPIPAEIIRELPVVAADLPLQDTIDVMRTGSAHMASVLLVGPAGTAVLGVITMDDLLTNLIHPE